VKQLAAALSMHQFNECGSTCPAQPGRSPKLQRSTGTTPPNVISIIQFPKKPIFPEINALNEACSTSARLDLFLQTVSKKGPALFDLELRYCG
jgi:hypothetical protein